MLQLYPIRMILANNLDEDVMEYKSTKVDNNYFIKISSFFLISGMYLYHT